MNFVYKLHITKIYDLILSIKKSFKRMNKELSFCFSENLSKTLS